MRTLVIIAALLVLAPLVRSRLAGTDEISRQWPDGTPMSVQEVRLDDSGRRVLEGRHAAWYESGAPLVEGRHHGGRRDGLWRWWYEDGRVLGECEYEHGEGIYRGWHPDGTLHLQGRYDGERRVGVWIEYYPSGRKRLQGGYRDGRQHGIWTAWTDADPQEAVQSEWRDGERVR